MLYNVRSQRLFAFVWSSGGEKKTRNIIPSLSSCWFMLLDQIHTQNGSEGIVCLWFSFERVWSFLNTENSLENVNIKKLLKLLLRGSAKKVSYWSDICFASNHLSFLVQLFSLSSFNIWFSYFLTSRRNIKIDRNPIWFLVFYNFDGSFIFCDFSTRVLWIISRVLLRVISSPPKILFKFVKKCHNNLLP